MATDAGSEGSGCVKVTDGRRVGFVGGVAHTPIVDPRIAKD
jgi:hypothetical protein